MKSFFCGLTRFPVRLDKSWTDLPISLSLPQTFAWFLARLSHFDHQWSLLGLDNGLRWLWLLLILHGVLPPHSLFVFVFAPDYWPSFDLLQTYLLPLSSWFSLFDSLQLLVLSNPVNMLFLFAFSLHFTLLMLIWKPLYSTTELNHFCLPNFS